MKKGKTAEQKRASLARSHRYYFAQASERRAQRAAMPLHVRLTEVGDHTGAIRYLTDRAAAAIEAQAANLSAGKPFCPTDIINATRRLREAATQLDTAARAALEENL